MATPKLLLSKLLRCRLRTLKTISISSSCSHTDTILFAQLINPTNPKRICGSNAGLHYNGSSLFFRSFSTHDSGDPIQAEDLSALISSADCSGGDSILPVRALISILDSYHDFTGFPWWVIIASSTLALRITLLPVLILQLKKLKKIAESFPKLPPPFPPPLSGRSYIDQFSLFHKERRAIGSPSYLWFLAYVSLQVPCFLLWMTTVRRMSLDHHPGFDCGGTLWFQNLTEFPHGVLGPIFPLLIASLHYVNVQVSFRTSSTGKVTGLFSLLAKYYKFYLDLLALPILFTGFCVPQGSLIYWLTNSSVTLIQQLSLNHHGVREKLGLPKKVDPVPTANREEMDTPVETQAGQLRQQDKIPLEDLSPRELLALSVTHLAKGHKDKAIPLLRLVLDKDPEYVRAMVVMGQTLLQNKQLVEATDYFERAISKLFLIGHPTEVEEIDLLILASQWAGVAYIRQGRNAEGIRHLERVANLKEPKDSKSKAHYYDAFILLASALYNEGRKSEAAKYLRLAAAYDSSYSVYLEECEKDEDAFVKDLVSSRRRDY
ncbi:ALBINO3-like protein 2, chloroplastic isoform X1 [Actinidia eriantha]|uniref:ALBINO3-like protein 2, chloroplastic isoform X1 n=1 Tax=Actinidia eriantha TaxID=165200 RepID=UPI0025846059|nr:ALBINO3-like protein 2, chloroplastic isoform X1 [Actinidia eriantha]